MDAWVCDKCGQKFPVKYRERHLQAHEKTKTYLREYETSGKGYKRKDYTGDEFWKPQNLDVAMTTIGLSVPHPEKDDREADKTKRK